MLKYKDLVIDREKHTVSIHAESIELTVKEYDILELLVSNPKRCLQSRISLRVSGQRNMLLTKEW